MYMQIKLRNLLIAIAILPLPFVALPMLFNWMTSFDTKMQRAYEQIEYGSDFENSIGVLGEPIESSSEFSRALSGYERDIPAAELAKCTEFHTWRNGSNWFYCIGIDCKGVITVKAEGHS